MLLLLLPVVGGVRIVEWMRVFCGVEDRRVDWGLRQKEFCCHWRIWTSRLGGRCGVGLVVAGVDLSDFGLGSYVDQLEQEHSHEKKCWVSCSCLIA